MVNKIPLLHTVTENINREFQLKLRACVCVCVCVYVGGGVIVLVSALERIKSSGSRAYPSKVDHQWLPAQHFALRISSIGCYNEQTAAIKLRRPALCTFILITS